MRSVLEIQQRVLPPDDSDLLFSRSYVASLLYNDGRMAETQKEFVDILAVPVPANSLVPVRTLSMWTVAISHIATQENDPAIEQEFRAMLPHFGRLLGKEHPETLRALATLGRTLHHQKKWDDAVAIERLLLESTAHSLGKDHPDTVNARNILAGTLRQAGKPAEADKVMKSGT